MSAIEQDTDYVHFLQEYENGDREARAITGNLGEYIHRVFAAIVPDHWSLEHAQRVIDELIPVERCHHEHDCCARFYGGRAIVIGEDFWLDQDETKLIWIKRTYSQNI